MQRCLERTCIVISFIILYCCYHAIVSIHILSVVNGKEFLETENTSATSAKPAWDPTDTHPCTVRRYSDAQWHATSFRKYGGRRSYGVLPSLYHEPVVLQRRRSVNAALRNRTHRDTILSYFAANFTVTLSSSNALSEHRRTILFSDYLDESWKAIETTPQQWSNESWYLFGETYTKQWREFLHPYILPPCEMCVAEKVALSFGIGNRGSGVQWHVHGPGFSEALHGRKHWVLYPPTRSNSSDKTKQQFHKDQSSRQWMEYVYPTVLVKPLECTLEPGDIIYFPNQWWHATINLDRYTAFISTFTTEHVADDSDDPFRLLDEF
jgi:Cupin-like domain